ncbi:MAG TPA: fasciclin domain-containing protein [Methanothrix sp.]|nr:fasciclin domain-containing protein [Methanothrix sp.]HPR66522.1 fasciclin domain-containing protein [Methanothrix sp.]
MVKKAFIALIFVSMLSIGMSAAEDEKMKTITETAAADGNFSTLLAAVDAAGLTDTLNGEGPFTVFATTDEAFDNLLASMEIDMNDIEGLTEVLNRHVAPGVLMAADVVNMTSIETLGGENITVEVTDEGLLVGGANVTAKDIVCSNGVIHVIDAVLMPPAEEMTEESVEEPVGEMTVEVEEPESEMADDEGMETDEAEC